MKIGIIRLIIGILIALCLVMGYTVYSNSETIYEQNETLSRSITGEEADIIYRMKAGRNVMTKQSEEIIEIDNNIEALNQRKEDIWIDYNENYEMVTELKKAAKDRLGLN